MDPVIIERGRGPEIAGTRITVYDIMDYLRMDWHHTAIASWLRLSSRQVLCAIQYIDEHKEELTKEYQKILDRAARGNPPEVQSKLDAIHAKYQALWAGRKKVPQETSNGEHPGG